MSGEADYDVKIRVSVEDDASDQIAGITNASSDLQNQTSYLSDATQRTTFSFSKYGSVLTGVGRIGTGMLHMYTAWNVQQLRLAKSQDSVNAAMRRLDTARATGDYKQITEATKELTDAQEAQKQAIIESDIALVAFGLHGAGIFGKGLKMVPKIADLARGAKTSGGADAMSNIAASTAGSTIGNFVGKIKAFAGTKVGQLAFPAIAFVTTWEILQDPAINAMNPFKQLVDSYFMLTHTPEQVKIAQAQAKANEEAAAAASSQVQITNNIIGYSASDIQAMQMQQDQMFGNFQP